MTFSTGCAGAAEPPTPACTWSSSASAAPQPRFPNYLCLDCSLICTGSKQTMKSTNEPVIDEAGTKPTLGCSKGRYSSAESWWGGKSCFTQEAGSLGRRRAGAQTIPSCWLGDRLQRPRGEGAAKV